MDRRNFLKILGITSSTAMLSSCGVDKANEKIIPYVIPPDEEVYPGKPLYVSTTCTECPANCGLQVKVNEKLYHEQRSLYPTKLEGIPNHPINRGGLCARGQAGLFRLYHPERIKRPMVRDEQGNWRIITWSEVVTRIQDELQKTRRLGKINTYLSNHTNGTISQLKNQFCQEYGFERLPDFELFSHANIKKANQLVFNKQVIPQYRIAKTDFLLSLGADILETFVSPVEHTYHFSIAKKNQHFRWYHLEPHVSLTGVQADHRIVIYPESEIIFLSYLIQTLFRESHQKRNLPFKLLRSIPTYSLEETAQQTGINQQDLQKLVGELSKAENPLIISGGISTAHAYGLEVAVLTALLQWILGITSEVVNFINARNYENIGTFLDINNLLHRLDQNEIGVFFLSKCDPAGQLPVDWQFLEKLKKASFSIGLADCLNATVRACNMILPLSHTLESWGDAQPFDGLHSIFQPAIEPQYDSKTEGDILLSLLNNNSEFSLYYKDYLFNNLKSRFGETNTSKLLQNGFIRTAVPESELSINLNQVYQFLKNFRIPQVKRTELLVFAPSIRGYDGRSTDLVLLNEIPDPLTTISYGAWLSVSEETATRMSLKDGDEVEVRIADERTKLPVKKQKLLPENVNLVQYGVVRLLSGSYDKRSGELFWFIKDIILSKTGNHVKLPVLSGSMDENGRGILPHVNEHGHEKEGKPWYPEHEHENYRWGMAIDLESCIGCNACSAACYVENNIPIVGREEHLLGREMSWIRIQPYVQDNESIEFVPMMCQHCDNAPCEPVCPVYAAYHNPEGLNVQVYNRCVGTRYCANNCPYKARRFNWFDHRLPEPLDKMYNPDISIRDRGIMEKCTFCIQRIRAAKDKAKDDNRLVQEGEVIPACAQTCPTKAITFGNLEDKNSKAYKLAHSEQAYRALEELGTKPAVNYLGKKREHYEA